MGYSIIIIDIKTNNSVVENKVDHEELFDSLEIVELSSIMYKITDENKIGNILEFQKYIKPTGNINLTEYMRKQLKITEENINLAESLESVYNKHKEWIETNTLPNDRIVIISLTKKEFEVIFPMKIKKLGLELTNHYMNIIDIKTSFSKKFKTNPNILLNSIKQSKINNLKDHSSGIDDCKYLGKIVTKMIEEKHIF